MAGTSKTYLDLLELIDKQNEIIERLVNENAEQESMINALLANQLSC